MIFAGIDFSINSPGICILSEGSYYFYGMVRDDDLEYASKKKNAQLISLSSLNNVLITRFDKISKGSTYSDDENIKLVEARSMSNWISSILSSYVCDRENLKVGIEGFAFAATGNRLAELSGFQYVLRNVLIERHVDRFFIVSPATVKATAAKGRPDKDAMIDAFIQNIGNDPSLAKNSLRLALQSDPTAFKKGKGWIKPITDLVDSYFVLRSISKMDH